MGHVSNWLHDHNFHQEDLIGSREPLKTMWETVLLVALVTTIIITIIVLVSPDTAYTILSYFF